MSALPLPQAHPVGNNQRVADDANRTGPSPTSRTGRRARAAARRTAGAAATLERDLDIAADADDPAVFPPAPPTERTTAITPASPTDAAVPVVPPTRTRERHPGCR